jgi:hypothetical protein
MQPGPAFARAANHFKHKGENLMEQMMQKLSEIEQKEVNDLAAKGIQLEKPVKMALIDILDKAEIQKTVKPGQVFIDMRGLVRVIILDNSSLSRIAITVCGETDIFSKSLVS